ncbi:unnamed protein product [Blepharisma stoltei]|uniref:Uncharacterized protein n=1 Tax=Blepharisma stoltei TaxID=1481888 RepID=A0AAU9IKN4_9CILI|nr:unnamed protein product [Blepharisma stoltei]
MESKFLKRFRGRILSLEKSERFDSLVPINKNIKPSQIYKDDSPDPTPRKSSKSSFHSYHQDSWKNAHKITSSFEKPPTPYINWADKHQNVRMSVGNSRLKRKMKTLRDEYFSNTPKIEGIPNLPIKLINSSYQSDAEQNYSLRFTPVMKKYSYSIKMRNKDLSSPTDREYLTPIGYDYSPVIFSKNKYKF